MTGIPAEIRQKIIDQTTAAYNQRSGPVKVFLLTEDKYFVVEKYVREEPFIRYRRDQLSESLEADLEQLMELNFGYFTQAERIA